MIILLENKKINVTFKKENIIQKIKVYYEIIKIIFKHKPNIQENMFLELNLNYNEFKLLVKKLKGE